MPLLVRSALISSPPVLVATVRERARRGFASSIRASHSSSDKRLAEYHHARVVHRLQHADPAIARIQVERRLFQPRVGHRHRGRQALFLRLLLQMDPERALHGLDRDVLGPAGRQHGLEDGLGTMAGLGLLDNPLPQLRRDLLCVCRAHFSILRLNTIRSGSDAAASKA